MNTGSCARAGAQQSVRAGDCASQSSISRSVGLGSFCSQAESTPARMRVRAKGVSISYGKNTSRVFIRIC